MDAYDHDHKYITNDHTPLCIVLVNCTIMSLLYTFMVAQTTMNEKQQDSYSVKTENIKVSKTDCVSAPFLSLSILTIRQPQSPQTTITPVACLLDWLKLANV